ncbi:hypothetical protein C8F04DRAFT_1197759 [Mycena alexandri]|uniref:Uncharacterized protein n=1 Tax=Mycena alexandri TaxID=1745969 RepID=A0AAD6S1M8_9AGAR|nr:hypothetical protein C8F04DRAFT_1197759 [Mycena alexandri]
MPPAPNYDLPDDAHHPPLSVTVPFADPLQNTMAATSLNELVKENKTLENLPIMRDTDAPLRSERMTLSVDVDLVFSTSLYLYGGVCVPWLIDVLIAPHLQQIVRDIVRLRVRERHSGRLLCKVLRRRKPTTRVQRPPMRHTRNLDYPQSRDGVERGRAGLVDDQHVRRGDELEPEADPPLIPSTAIIRPGDTRSDRASRMTLLLSPGDIRVGAVRRPLLDEVKMKNTIALELAQAHPTSPPPKATSQVSPETRDHWQAARCTQAGGRKLEVGSVITAASDAEAPVRTPLAVDLA